MTSSMDIKMINDDVIRVDDIIIITVQLDDYRGDDIIITTIKLDDIISDTGFKTPADLNGQNYPQLSAIWL